MANTLQQRALVAANGLIADLWHDLPGSMTEDLDDLDQTKLAFVNWLKGFHHFHDRYRHEDYAVVNLAIRQAGRFYESALRLPHHTPEDYTYMCCLLSRALLVVYGWSDVQIGAHISYFRCLTVGVYRAFWQIDRTTAYVAPIWSTQLVLNEYQPQPN